MKAGQNVTVDENGVSVDLSGVETLKTDMAGVKSNVTELQGDVGTIQTDVSGLKNDMAGAEGNITSLQSQMSGVQEDIQNIRDGTTPVTVGVATTTKAGIVKPGSGLSVAGDGTLSAKVATASAAGIVKPGTGVEITADGTINVTAGGMSEEQADARYLKLIGGTLSGDMTISNGGAGVLDVEGVKIYKNNGAGVIKVGETNGIEIDETGVSISAGQVQIKVAEVDGSAIRISKSDKPNIRLSLGNNVALQDLENVDTYITVGGGNVTISASGVLSANGKKLQNVGTPTNDADAATKAYVDSMAGGRWTRLSSGDVFNLTKGKVYQIAPYTTAKQYTFVPVTVLAQNYDPRLIIYGARLTQAGPDYIAYGDINGLQYNASNDIVYTLIREVGIID